MKETKRVRLGRSRDQDGKSNVWSIEPRMEVEEVNKNGEEVNYACSRLKNRDLKEFEKYQ